MARTYRFERILGALDGLTRRVFAALYTRDAQFIFVRKIDAARVLASRSEATETSGITCVFVESTAALREIEEEIPLSIRDSPDELRRRLTQGCSVIVARWPKPSGVGHEIIGYGINEPGVYSALGRRGKLPSDILFNHYLAVVPEYRGQRIADVMRRAMDEYCCRHGFTKRCTVVSPSNIASVRSNVRAGLTHAGTVARISLLRGLFVWETPWRQIERAVRAVDNIV